MVVFMKTGFATVCALLVREIWWVAMKTQSFDHPSYLSLSPHTFPKVKLLPNSALGNHGMALFVCIYWTVLEQCVLSLFPNLIFESLWWKASTISIQNGVEVNKLAILALCRVCWTWSALCSSCWLLLRRKWCQLQRCLILRGCSTWGGSHPGMECELFPCWCLPVKCWEPVCQ